MERPSTTLGLRHVALYVKDLALSEHFYVALMGMDVEWRPDSDNVYLSSQGHDNLALHCPPESFVEGGDQQLDHMGFILETSEQVDEWQVFLEENSIEILKAAFTHRDGSRSFYCADPDGIVVQMIYHPPISARFKKDNAL